MHYRLPFSGLEANHLVHVLSVRCCVLAHENAINPPERCVLNHVQVWLPRSLPSLELLLEADVLQELACIHAVTILVCPCAG